MIADRLGEPLHVPSRAGTLSHAFLAVTTLLNLWLLDAGRSPVTVSIASAIGAVSAAATFLSIEFTPFGNWLSAQLESSPLGGASVFGVILVAFLAVVLWVEPLDVLTFMAWLCGFAAASAGLQGWTRRRYVDGAG